MERMVRFSVGSNRELPMAEVKRYSVTKYMDYAFGLGFACVHVSDYDEAVDSLKLAKRDVDRLLAEREELALMVRRLTRRVIWFDKADAIAVHAMRLLAGLGLQGNGLRGFAELDDPR